MISRLVERLIERVAERTAEKVVQKTEDRRVASIPELGAFDFLKDEPDLYSDLLVDELMIGVKGDPR